jgi:ABC-2 type transport system permease protein
VTVQHLVNIYRLGVKELRSLAHDRILIILIIWVFSGGIYVATTATSQELHNAPIAVVNEDFMGRISELPSSFPILKSIRGWMPVPILLS